MYSCKCVWGMRDFCPDLWCGMPPGRAQNLLRHSSNWRPGARRSGRKQQAAQLVICNAASSPRLGVMYIAMDTLYATLCFAGMMYTSTELSSTEDTREVRNAYESAYLPYMVLSSRGRMDTYVPASVLNHPVVQDDRSPGPGLSWGYCACSRETWLGCSVL